MTTERSSIESFKKQAGMATFASNAAQNTIKADTANFQLGSLQEQLNLSLIKQIEQMARAAENDHATAFLAAARKLTQAMPGKTTTNRSALFSTSAPHTAPAADDSKDNTFNIG